MSGRVTRLAVLMCRGLAISAALAGAQAQAERRVALLIGNAGYSRFAPLHNVSNDVDAMGALFKAAKFDSVVIRKNLGIAALREAVKELAQRAADADVAVLYYAGHGIEVGGQNYLIPVDARLASNFDVEDETVSLERALQAMAPAKRLRLAILDACRENPFLGSMKSTIAGRSAGRGLARIERTPPNTLVAFATAPNTIAADGRGMNSRSPALSSGT